MNRRTFLATSSAAAVGLAIDRCAPLTQAGRPPSIGIHMMPHGVGIALRGVRVRGCGPDVEESERQRAMEGHMALCGAMSSHRQA
jgi:hypothetical protein